MFNMEKVRKRFLYLEYILLCLTVAWVGIMILAPVVTNIFLGKWLLIPMIVDTLLGLVICSYCLRIIIQKWGFRKESRH